MVCKIAPYIKVVQRVTAWNWKKLKLVWVPVSVNIMQPLRLSTIWMELIKT